MESCRGKFVLNTKVVEILPLSKFFKDEGSKEEEKFIDFSSSAIFHE
jgi:hypothetical protein